jgi:hypothetical protein
MEIVAWGNKCLPSPGLRGLARVLEEGGPKLRAKFMSELREMHLPKSGAKKKLRSRAKSTRISAVQKLHAAYETELARR